MAPLVPPRRCGISNCPGFVPVDPHVSTMTHFPISFTFSFQVAFRRWIWLVIPSDTKKSLPRGSKWIPNGTPTQVHSAMKVASLLNTCNRLFPRSATQILCRSSVRIEWGWKNCECIVPLLPSTNSSLRSLENFKTRLLIFPESPSAIQTEPFEED